MNKFIVLSLALAAPAAAAERGLSITDFDRLRVDGSFTVIVTTGRGTSARILGTPAAIDASSVEVQGRTLTIRRNRNAWGTSSGQESTAPTVRVTAPLLTNVWVSGPAKVSVDRMKGLRIAASLEGAGELAIAAVAADRLDVATVGSGTMTLAGTVANLTLVARGAGTIDAAKLLSADIKLTSESAGTITLAAKRSANLTMTGTGSVIVIGKPACTVRNMGAGTVTCGAKEAPVPPVPPEAPAEDRSRPRR